jgi:hypothetical protein
MSSNIYVRLIHHLQQANNDSLSSNDFYESKTDDYEALLPLLKVLPRQTWITRLEEWISSAPSVLCSPEPKIENAKELLNSIRHFAKDSYENAKLMLHELDNDDGGKMKTSSLPEHDPTLPVWKRMKKCESYKANKWTLKNEFAIDVGKEGLAMRDTFDTSRHYVPVDNGNIEDICTPNMIVPEKVMSLNVDFMFGITRLDQTMNCLTRLWESQFRSISGPYYELMDSNWVYNRSELDLMYGRWYMPGRKLMAIPKFLITSVSRKIGLDGAIDFVKNLSEIIEYLSKDFSRELVTFVLYDRGVDTDDITQTFVGEELFEGFETHIEKCFDEARRPLFIIEGRPSIGKTFFGHAVEYLFNNVKKDGDRAYEDVIYVSEPSFPLYSDLYDANFRSRLIEELRYYQLDIYKNMPCPLFIERYTFTVPWLLNDSRDDRNALATLNEERAKEFLIDHNFSPFILFLVNREEEWDDSRVEQRSKSDWTNRVVQNGKNWLTKHQNDIPFTAVAVI